LLERWRVPAKDACAVVTVKTAIAQTTQTTNINTGLGRAIQTSLSGAARNATRLPDADAEKNDVTMSH
jgi:hypothetical protein